MTPAQVAEKLQLHSKTLINLAERWILLGMKLGSRWRFVPSVIDAWMRGGK
jgi:hypothetical protein